MNMKKNLGKSACRLTDESGTGINTGNADWVSDWTIWRYAFIGYLYQLSASVSG